METHHHNGITAKDGHQEPADRPGAGEAEEKDHHPEHGEHPKAEASYDQVQGAAEADAAPPSAQGPRRYDKRRQASKRNHLFVERRG